VWVQIYGPAVDEDQEWEIGKTRAVEDTNCPIWNSDFAFDVMGMGSPEVMMRTPVEQFKSLASTVRRDAVAHLRLGREAHTVIFVNPFCPRSRLQCCLKHCAFCLLCHVDRLLLLPLDSLRGV